MIIGFKFKNYRSYRDEAEFSLIAQESNFNSDSITIVELNSGDSLRLLNVAAIFGANASGKSNVIYVLNDLSNMVRNSLSYNQKHSIPIRWQYAFSKDCQKQPTEVSIDFIVNKERYLYEVVAINNNIEKEKLSRYVDNEFKAVFERLDNKSGGLSLNIGDGYQSTALDLSYMNLLSNQLLLSWLATKKANGLQDVADYLAGLNINTPNQITTPQGKLNQIAETYFDNCKSPIYGQFAKLMKLADLGVEDTCFVRHDDSDFNFHNGVPDDEKKRLIEQYRWEFYIAHKMDNNEGNCLLPLNLESEGTRALVAIAPTILYALNKGLFLAYDEINTAIHPSMFRLLVNLFQNPKTNPNGAQLLFTTHDASVADFNTLRADQIWFTEKKDGSSELFSAQDFENVSINVPFEKWYRAGRFGALPTLNPIDYIFE